MELPKPEHGKWDSSEDFIKEGTLYTLTCDDGFKIEGDAVWICTNTTEFRSLSGQNINPHCSNTSILGRCLEMTLT